MGGMVPFPDEILAEICRMTREPLVINPDPRTGWMERLSGVIDAARSKN
jgi:hypothetical protein